MGSRGARAPHHEDGGFPWQRSRSPRRSQHVPIPRFGYLLLVGAVLVLWLVTFEAGPVPGAVGQAGSFLHELFHDGRHLLGVPCH